MTVATDATILPSCLAGTCPINIIKNIMVHSSAAVDKFSIMIGGTMKRHTIKMYFMARLSAPWLVCMALRI